MFGSILLPHELDDAADCGRIGEIGECAKVQLPFRLLCPRAAHEAAVPGLAPPPSHRKTFPSVQVVVFQLRSFVGVGQRSLQPIRELGKENTRRELPRSLAGDAVRTGAGEQHRGLPAAVGAGQHAYRIAEGHAELPDPAEIPDADFVEEVTALRAACPQCVPHLMKLPIDQRHVTCPLLVVLP